MIYIADDVVLVVTIYTVEEKIIIPSKYFFPVNEFISSISFPRLFTVVI